MTDLTEQWKQKGLILDKEYYIRLLNDEIYTATYQQRYDDCHWPSDLGFDVFSNKRIKEVLAPVPSYEEWQASEKYNKHLEEVIKIYERKDKQATETSIAYNELLEENAQLKELLKECLAHLTIGKYGTSVTPINILCDEVEEVLK